MYIKNEDLNILCEIEMLTHDLIEKYIPEEYDEEGNVINKEWELWTTYWNIIEKLIQQRDKRNKINSTRIYLKRQKDKTYARSKKEIERILKKEVNK